MTFSIPSIFLPSVGIDIVFNINSLTPYSRSSIIYDSDFKNHTVTIAQPLTPLTHNTVFKQLHLSTILNVNNKPIRVGIPCKQFTVIDRYALANNKNVGAVQMTYTPPAKEINIRSAFRLPLSAKYIIKGKILYQDLDYYTSRDFSIRDISLTGVGVVIPKIKNKITNPLTTIKQNETIRMGIILVNTELDSPIGTLPFKARVSRVNQNYSSTHMLVGLNILKLKTTSESMLNKFIHDAQIDELKRLSRRNL